MKAIGVIGQGFVGGSLTTVFAERGFDVYVYDKTGKVAPGGKNAYIPNADGMRTPQFLPKSSSEFARACEIEKNFSGVYFVCLPTPMYEDGSADLSIVEGVLRELAETPGRRIAVVKSTVPPGTTERWNAQFVGSGLRVIFNPEFLTEANALDDMRNQNRIILGGPRPHINTVKLVFQSAFPKVPLVKTSSTTAEMVKYVINCFLATKVAFANEVAQVCEALDDKGLNIDYDKVVEYAKLDTRLGNSHWAVPGPVPTHDGRYVRGFGGHCVIHGTQVKQSSSDTPVQLIQPGSQVVSADHRLENNDTKIVREIHARSYDGPVIKFTVSIDNEERTVTCTPEHLLPVKRDGQIAIVQAQSVVETDELFVS
jgi:nucleotide sugar dehydrogenase